MVLSLAGNHKVYFPATKPIFTKINNLPGGKYVKYPHWRFCVGFINIDILQVPNWPLLHPQQA